MTEREGYLAALQSGVEAEVTATIDRLGARMTEDGKIDVHEALAAACEAAIGAAINRYATGRAIAAGGGAAATENGITGAVEAARRAVDARGAELLRTLMVLESGPFKGNGAPR